MASWTFQDIPDQTGRTAVVTGANTGLGFETARMLAEKGADVILACRTGAKGEAAVEKIRALKPKGTVTFAALDLADLDSVAAFARDFVKGHTRLDLLINNAGVMVPPLSRTAQGFELQLGTNHLGHFALTGQLLPLIEQTPGSRVVVLSSLMQNVGRIDLTDLNWERRSYSDWFAYGQSKLADMMFALELHRRLAASGSSVRVTAAHPGYTATELQRTSGIARFWNPLVAMKPSDGALPTLRAATDPAAESGTYWGPCGLFEISGAPAPARISARARDEGVARQLWEASEELTKVRFVFASSLRKAS